MTPVKRSITSSTHGKARYYEARRIARREPEMKRDMLFTLGTITTFTFTMIIAALMFTPGFLVVFRYTGITTEPRSAEVEDSTKKRDVNWWWTVMGYILMAAGLLVGVVFGASIVREWMSMRTT